MKSAETFIDVQRRGPWGSTPSVPNLLVASVEHVSYMRLAYVEFCYFFFSTCPAQVSLIGYCVTAVLVFLM